MCRLRRARAGFARCPPAAPAWLRAVPTPTGVQLSWPASASRGLVNFGVCRRPGTPPRQPGDGEALGETAATTLLDASTSPGVLYFYAVFSERGGVCSATGATCGPVQRLAEVSDVRVLARDRCIELSWTPPPNVRGIQVWRKEGARRPPRRGTRVNATERTSVADAGLVNGRTYGYRICAMFVNASGQPISSAGVTATVTPLEPPRPVTDLAACARATSSRPPGAAGYRPGVRLRFAAAAHRDAGRTPDASGTDRFGHAHSARESRQGARDHGQRSACST